jgi:hypothetical protein
MEQARTSRVRRTWFEKLKLWNYAYQTEIWHKPHQVVGRGSTPEASRETAEKELKRLLD